MSVRYNWAGAGPAAVERSLTAPLEGAFALVGDVDRITSVSEDGGGSIRIRPVAGADADLLRFHLAAQVRRLYPTFPERASYPTISYQAAAEDEELDVPVLTYSLSGPDGPAELYRYAAEQLVPRLSLEAGLNRLEVTGGNRMHWRIALDPAAVARAGLTTAGITAHLRDYFGRSGLGFIEEPGRRDYVYLTGGFDGEPNELTVAEWHAVPLPSPTERALVLGDMATVVRAPLPARGHYRINGANSVRLLAYATEDANRIALSSKLRTRVRAQESTLPPGYTIRLEDDATRFLRDELAKTRRRTALSLGILLVFVLIAYRSFRRLGVVLFSLAVNLGLAFLSYWLLGVELNLYAFAGIAVSFGIMVDNVIIVLDGLRRPGGRLAPAIIGATLTTLAGLSVIWFLSEELRAQLFELARVMAINLSTSVLVALVFVPALLGGAAAGAKKGREVREGERSEQSRAAAISKIKRQTSPPQAAAQLNVKYQTLLRLLLRFRPLVLLLTLLAFGLPLWWLPRKADAIPFYNETLGSDYYRDVLRPPLNKYLGGSFRLFSYYVYEGGGYRPPEETRLYVHAALPDGATLAQLDDVVRRVEAYLGRYAGQLDRFTTRVSSGQNASIEITFPNGGRGGFPFTLKNRLTAYATNFGGVEWGIYGVGQGYSNSSFGQRANFSVILKGYDQAGLDRHSARLAGLLTAHPRVEEVDTDANINWFARERREFWLDFRPRDLARAGLSPTEFRAGLAWFDRADYPDFYLRGGEPVALVAQNGEDYDRWRLENWSIPRDSGRLDFSTLADLTVRPARQALHKEDQQYLRRIAFEYLGSPRFGSKHLNACLDTLRAELPLGFTAERRSYNPDEEAKELTALMGLAVLLIFFICALLFESLRQALSIVLLIPVSCIGIFLTFYWFDVRLDQGGYTSFLLVAGLAVNGMILIVNEYNWLRKHRPDWDGPALYAEAVRRKILPILLTVVSTAAGLAPFLLGGRNEVFWYALAAGTIGGLVFSVMVITVVSPLFFLRRG